MSKGSHLFEKLSRGKSKERNPVTIYVSRPLFVEFRKLCEKHDVSASIAIEQMIRDELEFADSNQSKPAPLPLSIPNIDDGDLALVLGALRETPSRMPSILAAAGVTPASGKKSKHGR